MIGDKNLERDFLHLVITTGEESCGKLNSELATQKINRACFTDEFSWKLYAAVYGLARRGANIGISEVSAGLGPDSWRTVAEHWPEVPKFGSLRILGEKLREYSSRRSAAEVGQKIIEAAKGNRDDFGEHLINAAASLKAHYAPDGSGVESGETVLLRFYEELERAQSGDCNSGAITTGIQRFDETTGGLQKNFLSIIGAYPGCFKSGIMATIAANIANSGKKVGFFSLEDNPIWLAKRYVSRATGIPVQEMLKRRLSQYELTKIAETQETVIRIASNLFVDSRSGLSGHDVASSARFMIAEKGCSVIIIDHIGEMQAGFKRRDRHDLEVTENVRAIRDVAKDTGCAVLMASHLRRREDGEEDIHRIPKMTDFSDSSSIEKMCRLALGLWQPSGDQNTVSLKVLKQNEGGARGTIFSLTKDAKSALVKND